MDNKTKPISLRVNSEALTLITLAAKEKGITRAEFIMQAAVDLAKETLLDRTTFTLNAEEFDAFERSLNKETDDNPYRRQLMAMRYNYSNAWPL